ncbi:MAG: 4Fe-4S binding protein [Polyangiaceae bacterium]
MHAPAEAIATTGVGVTRAPAPPWALARTASHALAAPPPGQKVRVVQSACLAWQGSPCWTCVERCPIEGAITTDGGRPTVDASLCDGCGQCVHACPAPTLALKFLDASAVKDPVA